VRATSVISSRTQVQQSLVYIVFRRILSLEAVVLGVIRTVDERVT
jgi:hypothetical protein